MRLIVALLIWSVSVCCVAQSTSYYKSVHTDGTVSYSDTRPASASTVETINVPRTNADIVNQGQRRAQEMNAIAEDLEKQRSEQAKARRKYESRLAEARQEVVSAERNLSTTQQSKHNATEERIGLAEERVKLARQRLREIQNAGP